MQPTISDVSNQSTVLSNRHCVVNTATTTQLDVFRLNGTQVFRLGLTSIAFGIVISVCGMCAVALFGSKRYNMVASGVWGGVFIIVAGALSTASGLRPNSRIINAVNLVSQSFSIVCCIACLILFGVNIRYYDTCVVSQYMVYGEILSYFENKSCPTPEKDVAVVVYSCMLVLAFVQLGISIAAVVFCCRAYPMCYRDCCLETTANAPPTNQPTNPTGHATISPNTPQNPPDQILYRITPVTVPANQIPQTTQHAQEMSANQTPLPDITANQTAQITQRPKEPTQLSKETTDMSAIQRPQTTLSMDSTYINKSSRKITML